MKEVTVLDYQSFNGEDRPSEKISIFLTPEDEFNIQRGKGLCAYNDNVKAVVYRFTGDFKMFDEDENEVDYEDTEIRIGYGEIRVDKDSTHVILQDENYAGWELHIEIAY